MNKPMRSTHLLSHSLANGLAAAKHALVAMPSPGCKVLLDFKHEIRVTEANAITRRWPVPVLQRARAEQSVGE